jgi:hypothetical protein
MKKFIITEESCTTGFYEHVTLNLTKPIEDQLRRRYLYVRKGPDEGKASDLIKIIEQNSSLRISFGWSFESTEIYERMMEECLRELLPKYNTFMPNLVSDTRCDWLGFLPFNCFEKDELKDLSIYSLILFNNEMVKFQTEVVRFIATHKSFLQHSLIRNDEYRFKYYKDRRKDPVALSEAFQYYIESVKDTTGIESIPQSFVEEFIGCHFLHHPETFFELMNFFTLKGNIYDK